MSEIADPSETVGSLLLRDGLPIIDPNGHGFELSWHRILRLSGITGQGVSPFFEARRERLTAFQVLACKIMPERRLRFATIAQQVW